MYLLYWNEITINTFNYLTLDLKILVYSKQLPFVSNLIECIKIILLLSLLLLLLYTYFYEKAENTISVQNNIGIFGIPIFQLP